MNKLSKPASNCGTAKSMTIHGNAISGGNRLLAWARVRRLFVYERSGARPRNLSSTVAIEKHRCRIKTQLPSAAVHKSGKPFHRECRACTFVCKRYLRKDLKRCLQRSIGVEPRA